MGDLPHISDFLSSRGEPLRELFAVAVMRALSPMERAGVLSTLAAHAALSPRELVKAGEGS